MEENDFIYCFFVCSGLLQKKCDCCYHLCFVGRRSFVSLIERGLLSATLPKLKIVVENFRRRNSHSMKSEYSKIGDVFVLDTVTLQILRIRTLKISELYIFYFYKNILLRYFKDTHIYVSSIHI